MPVYLVLNKGPSIPHQLKLSPEFKFLQTHKQVFQYANAITAYTKTRSGVRLWCGVTFWSDLLEWDFGVNLVEPGSRVRPA